MASTFMKQGNESTNTSATAATSVGGTPSETSFLPSLTFYTEFKIAKVSILKSSVYTDAQGGSTGFIRAFKTDQGETFKRDLAWVLGKDKMLLDNEWKPDEYKLVVPNATHGMAAKPFIGKSIDIEVGDHDMLKELEYKGAYEEKGMPTRHEHDRTVRGLALIAGGYVTRQVTPEHPEEFICWFMHYDK